MPIHSPVTGRLPSSTREATAAYDDTVPFVSSPAFTRRWLLNEVIRKPGQRVLAGDTNELTEIRNHAKRPCDRMSIQLGAHFQQLGCVHLVGSDPWNRAGIKLKVGATSNQQKLSARYSL